MTSIKPSTTVSFFLLLCGSMLFWGCPSKPPEPATTPLSNTLKQYFGFPEGSYWIYEDSLTTAVDSSVYTNYLLDENVGHNFGNCTLERMRVQLYRSFYDITLNGSTETFCDTFDETFFFGPQPVFFRSMVESSSNPGVLDEIDPGTEGNGIVYVALHSTYTVRGTEYPDVREYRITQSLGDAWFAQVYFAPGVGMVKQVTEDGRIWELVRYQVD